ncbi:MAG: DUF3459 domain-containing protein, partial [Clostridium sp.]|nr:DUF3459 domain-containing protein [Clostridium sp.]
DEKNAYTDRYIWTDFCFGSADGLNFVGGESERSGSYILNFFKCQPALNYGFLNPRKKWELPMDAPGPRATVEAMKDVMRFWLSHGCDGFRVDMASSLVKYDDEKKTGTSAIWREVRQMLDAEFPEAAMVSEWSNPPLALGCGFDMDFILNDPWTGYHTLMRDYQFREDGDEENHSYFKCDAGGDIHRFLDKYLNWYQETKDKGYMSLITCNHDTVRPRYGLTEEELKLCYGFLFTMPGVPFLYYGDEIGMQYQELKNFEGGYYRTGSRTPMQWNSGRNLGFSDAPADALYLPVDPSPEAPTVESQEAREDSLLHTVRALLALRHQETSLQADEAVEFLCTEKEGPLVYRRGELLMVLNTTSETLTANVEAPECRPLFSIAGEAASEGGRLTAGPRSFTVLKALQ